MPTCEWWEREFTPSGAWEQRFCCSLHRNAWNRQRRREEKQQERAEALRDERGNGFDRGTPEQREQATQALAGITAGFVVGKFVRRV